MTAANTGGVSDAEAPAAAEARAASDGASLSPSLVSGKALAQGALGDSHAAPVDGGGTPPEKALTWGPRAAASGVGGALGGASLGGSDVRLVERLKV